MIAQKLSFIAILIVSIYSSQILTEKIVLKLKSQSQRGFQIYNEDVVSQYPHKPLLCKGTFFKPVMTKDGGLLPFYFLKGRIFQEGCLVEKAENAEMEVNQTFQTDFVDRTWKTQLILKCSQGSLEEVLSVEESNNDIQEITKFSLKKFKIPCQSVRKLPKNRIFAVFSSETEGFFIKFQAKNLESSNSITIRQFDKRLIQWFLTSSNLQEVKVSNQIAELSIKSSSKDQNWDQYDSARIHFENCYFLAKKNKTMQKEGQLKMSVEDENGEVYSVNLPYQTLSDPTHLQASILKTSKVYSLMSYELDLNQFLLIKGNGISLSSPIVDNSQTIKNIRLTADDSTRISFNQGVTAEGLVQSLDLDEDDQALSIISTNSETRKSTISIFSQNKQIAQINNFEGRIKQVKSFKMRNNSSGMLQETRCFIGIYDTNVSTSVLWIRRLVSKTKVESGSREIKYLGIDKFNIIIDKNHHNPEFVIIFNKSLKSLFYSPISCTASVSALDIKKIPLNEDDVVHYTFTKLGSILVFFTSTSDSKIKISAFNTENNWEPVTVDASSLQVILEKSLDSAKLIKLTHGRDLKGSFEFLIDGADSSFMVLGGQLKFSQKKNQIDLIITIQEYFLKSSLNGINDCVLTKNYVSCIWTQLSILELPTQLDHGTLKEGLSYSILQIYKRNYSSLKAAPTHAYRSQILDPSIDISQTQALVSYQGDTIAFLKTPQYFNFLKFTHQIKFKFKTSKFEKEGSSLILDLRTASSSFSTSIKIKDILTLGKRQFPTFFYILGAAVLLGFIFFWLSWIISKFTQMREIEEEDIERSQSKEYNSDIYASLGMAQYMNME